MVLYRQCFRMTIRALFPNLKHSPTLVAFMVYPSRLRSIAVLLNVKHILNTSLLMTIAGSLLFCA